MTPTRTGHLERRDGADLIVLERTFAAPIDSVWAAVTESDRLARWFGTWTGDPASGSVQLTMTAEGDDPAPVTTEILACEPPRLLHLLTVDDYGRWDITLRLSHAAGTTTLAFEQVLHPAAPASDIGPGWEWYLDRLVAAETGQDVAALDFERDYAPLGAAYKELPPPS